MAYVPGDEHCVDIDERLGNYDSSGNWLRGEGVGDIATAESYLDYDRYLDRLDYSTDEVPPSSSG